MNKKKAIILGIIVLTIGMISGVSFALWQITLTADSTNTITTGCFRVSFEEQNPISLENAFPITKEEGKSLTPYTFTITNTCESYASYQINLEILNNTTFENLDYFDILFEDSIFTLKEKETVPTTLSNATTARKLETGYLDVNQSKTFELRIWLDENTPNEEEFMNQIFSSKITAIATHQTEFDRETPSSNFEVTNLSNQIYVDAKNSSDNTSVKYYYYSLDGESFVKTKEPEYTFEVGELNYGVATDTIKTLADSLSEEYTVYVKTEDEYGNISEVVTKKVYKEFAYDNTTDNNLRYIGASPNNYVLFNDELWRIIGVMENIDDGTGKKETRIKLIRNESIGGYSWDSSDIGINGGHGINEWSQADVNTLLNDYYYNRTMNQRCFVDVNNISQPCDFNEVGLLDTTKELIDNSLLYLGASENISDPQSFYQSERGEKTGKICSGIYCTDNVVRSTRWIGKIGLMYPSDYGYATSGGHTTSRETCLNVNLDQWNNNDISDCKNNNWIYKIDKNQWTITPIIDAAYSCGALYLYPAGNLGFDGAFGAGPIHPTLYLKSSIKINKGLGTQNNPYELSM